MIHIHEIQNQYKSGGSHPVLVRSAFEIFQEWQREHPEAEVIMVQKVDSGLFVTYKKKVEFAGKKK